MLLKTRRISEIAPAPSLAVLPYLQPSNPRRPRRCRSCLWIATTYRSLQSPWSRRRSHTWQIDPSRNSPRGREHSDRRSAARKPMSRELEIKPAIDFVSTAARPFSCGRDTAKGRHAWPNTPPSIFWVFQEKRRLQGWTFDRARRKAKPSPPDREKQREANLYRKSDRKEQGGQGTECRHRRSANAQRKTREILR